MLSHGLLATYAYIFFRYFKRLWRSEKLATGYIFYMLSHNVPYHELGANYFDARRRPYTVDRLARRIEHLGYRVHLEPVTAPAA